MKLAATTVPVGRIKMTAIRRPAPGVRGFVTHALPRPGLPAEVNIWRLKNMPRLVWQFAKISLAVSVSRLCGVATVYGRVSLRVTRKGVIYDYGIASYRVVTTAGVNYLVDALENLVEPENLKYHGFGTGTAAEATSDTALGTELTTQYATDNTRPTGTQTENGANVYETVATLTPDSGGTIAVTEHGIFSQAATGGGTLLDRSKFAAVNLDSTAGDSLQATYDLTLTAGG